jgi:hypothetical protein
MLCLSSPFSSFLNVDVRRLAISSRAASQERVYFDAAACRTPVYRALCALKTVDCRAPRDSV